MPAARSLMIALSVAGAKFLLAGTMHEVSVSVELGAGSYMKQTTANLSHNEMQLGRVVLGMLLQTLALLVRKRSGIQGIRLLQVLTFPGQKQCQPRQAHLSTGTRHLEVARQRMHSSNVSDGQRPLPCRIGSCVGQTGLRRYGGVGAYGRTCSFAR